MHIPLDLFQRCNTPILYKIILTFASPTEFVRTDVLLCPGYDDWYKVTLPSGVKRYTLSMGVEYEHSLGDIDIELRSVNCLIAFGLFTICIALFQVLITILQSNDTVIASSGEISGFEAVIADNAPA